MIKSLLSKDILIIPVVTVIIYYISVCYEAGYASHFGFSIELVSIDIKSYFMVGFIFATFVALFLLKWSLSRAIVFLITSGVIFSLAYYFYESNLVAKEKGIIILYAMFTFPPLILKILISFFYKLLGTPSKEEFFIGIIFILLMTGIYTTILGNVAASQKSSFNSFVYNEKEYVILRIYGTKIVAGRMENNTLTKDILFIPESSATPIELKKIILIDNGGKMAIEKPNNQ
jgi:hypothetical protein